MLAALRESATVKVIVRLGGQPAIAKVRHRKTPGRPIQARVRVRVKGLG